jgi:rfaE bifunctional protein kinase chain/domain
MVELVKILSRLKKIKALIIGDFMVDKYTIGKIKRISPEAPVSILHSYEEKDLPGGAGNVVMNFLSMTAKVVALGRIGEDIEGERLINNLKDAGADISYMIKEPNYITPVKNRLIADNQQIIRVDKENISNLDKTLEDKIVSILPTLLEEIEIIAISDYGKGFLSDRLLREIISLSKKKNIPVIVDPKGLDFAKYKGATIIKPNQSEAYAAAKLDESKPIEEVAKVLLDITEAEKLLITRSKDGISYFDRKNNCYNFPVHSKEVKDVTGAGDTVLAMISIAIASGIGMDLACNVANIAASIVIERVGCSRITLYDLAKRLLEVDSGNKIFDEAHLYALVNVLENKKFSVLALEESSSIQTTTFSIIRKLAKDKTLIIYFSNPNIDEEIIHLFSSLKEVDFIILDEISLRKLCSELAPESFYEVKEKEMIKLDSLESLSSFSSVF